MTGAITPREDGGMGLLKGANELNEEGVALAIALWHATQLREGGA